MSDSKSYGPSDAIALGKQFWDSWTQFAQQQAGNTKSGPALPNWQDGFDFWSRLAGNPSNDASHAVEQLSQHGQRLMQMMQAISAKLAAGETVGPGDLGQSWKDLFDGTNPMLDTLGGIAAEGAKGWDQFAQGIEPVLAALRGEHKAMLGMPAFGIGRERQERLQAILQAQAEYSERTAAYHGLLARASQAGMRRFEEKLAEHSEPGRQIDSMRRLYDLWIDAAEETYAEVAMTDEFRSAYGAMVNAQMRLKQRVQHELDDQMAALGLPTRAELDGAHRKIHAMQRELREMRELLKQGAGAPTPAATAPAAATRPTTASRKATEKSSRSARKVGSAGSSVRKPSGTAKADATTRKPAAKRARKEAK